MEARQHTDQQPRASSGPLRRPAQAKMDPDYDSDLGPRPGPERSSPDFIVISDDDGAEDAAPRGRFKSLSLLDHEPSFGDTLQTYIEEDGDFDGAIEPEITRRACGEAKLLVQVDWDEATTAVGAKRVEIVNDDSDDDEDCPALPMGFKYMERGYQMLVRSCSSPTLAVLNAVDLHSDGSIHRLSSNLSQGSSSGLGCHCSGICDVTSPASCACQSYSEFNDRYAYDRLVRFFLFVIEPYR